jgi:hypothetical protein
VPAAAAPLRASATEGIGSPLDRLPFAQRLRAAERADAEHPYDVLASSPSPSSPATRRTSNGFSSRPWSGAT